MKQTAPFKCPMCGEMYQWKYVGSDNAGFSKGKAAIGAVALGPLGLAAGALGKKKLTYCCGKCGFTRMYDPN